MDDYLNRFKISTLLPIILNIVQVNNVESRLEIALAGFSKNEVKVYTEFGKLYVEGKKKNRKQMGEFVHKGLAQRDRSIGSGHSDDTEIRNVGWSMTDSSCL